jgi:hypothetical protein
MGDMIEGYIVLSAALLLCLNFFIYPDRFNGLIRWMFRIGNALPIVSIFWPAKQQTQWVARPFFIRLYFLPFVIMLSWFLLQSVKEEMKGQLSIFHF